MFIAFNLDPTLLSPEARRRAWLHAREEAAEAYLAWVAAKEPERKIAYAVYRAAEEREAAAADACAA